MRVLMLSFPYASAVGGGERYAEQLVEGLSTKGFSFALLSSSQALLSVFRMRGWNARPLWCGIEPVSMGAVILFPFTVPIILPILLAALVAFKNAGGRTVVCLSLTDKLLATPIARLLGARVVWIEHLVPGRALKLNPYRALYAWCARIVDIVVVSEAVAAGIVALGAPRGRIQIIPPGVVMPQERASLSGPPVVGVVARLAKEKNVSLVLRAFTRIPEATLEIFGDGPERENLERLAKYLGIGSRVSFRGHIDDPAQMYRHLTVLAVPSLKESFGIAALEAMSWGVPVVASRVEGLPELVEDGATGILVPPDDQTAMANALVRVITDRGLAERMGEAGRTRAASRYALANNITAWESLLHD